MLLAVAAGILVVVLFISWLFWWPNTFSDPAERTIYVSRGASFRQVVDSLVTNGVIRSRWSFNATGRLLRLTGSIRYGKYSFTSGISNLGILSDLKEGKSRVLISVTIPEGMRIEWIAHRFAQYVGIDSSKFVALATDSSIARSAGVKATTLEGYLLPDTYAFHWETDEREILDRMVDAFARFYVDSLVRRQRELGLTLHEVLTLASIVEAEARLPRERATIAGVYYNRLKKGMRLEADPTVQYAIPGGPRRLLYQDLRYPSPYNTYLIRGLPPGPIGNPGRGAILATLYPEKNGYLYFVADGTGGHKFSRTYAEHLRAVRTYRRHMREIRRMRAFVPSDSKL